MFKCTICGPITGKQHKIVTVIRKVEYLNEVKYDKNVFKEGKPTIESTYKTVKRSKGTEIVEEKNYCKKHIPKKTEAKILEEIIRKNLVGIKKAYRGEN